MKHTGAERFRVCGCEHAFAVLFCLTGLANSLFWSSSCDAAEPEDHSTVPQQVSLDEIWALNMPGTRDIEGIDLPSVPQASFAGWGFEEFKQYRKQAIQELRDALSSKPPADDALSGFVFTLPPEKNLLAVIRNVVAQAIDNDSVLVRENRIQSDRATYLVFYSHPASYYVQLEGVQRRGTSFDVAYSFVPHYTAESTVHLAMIPLGKLQSGDYQVDFQQKTMAQDYIDAGFVPVSPSQARRFVCRPFSFTVYDPPQTVTEEDPVSEQIRLDRVLALGMPGTQDIQRLFPDEAASIRRFLTHRSAESATAGPCFMVEGEGKTALHNAANVLLGEAHPVDSLTTSADLSLVFYSYAAPGYVYLHSVRHSGSRVTIRYQIVTHQTAEATVHFAIVPLGRLPAGPFSVEVIEVASETPYDNHFLADRSVCNSCSLTIHEGTQQ